MKYTRIYEVMNLQNLTMIKIAFNKENISFRTLFENTLHTGNVYALGNHGVIIEVAEKDLEKAKEILLSLEIQLDYDPAKDRFNFITKIDEKIHPHCRPGPVLQP